MHFLRIHKILSVGSVQEKIKVTSETFLGMPQESFALAILPCIVNTVHSRLLEDSVEYRGISAFSVIGCILLWHGILMN